MRNTLPKLGSLALVAALSTASCETASPMDPNNGACTSPKLKIMSDDVALAIKIVTIDMEIINLGNSTKIVHGNFKADDGTPPFTNVAMIVDAGKAYKCEQTEQSDGSYDNNHILCAIGTVGDLKQNPIALTGFQSIILSDRTVSINSPITQQNPLGTEWISASDSTCGAQDRYGTSGEFCAGQFSEAQLAVDSSRESVCTKDFETARDMIRGTYKAYNDQLIK